MHTAYLDDLRKALLKDSIDTQYLLQLEAHPFWYDHELAHAMYALVCQKVSRPCPDLKLKQNASGAVSIFERGFFPWKGLPYPREHAELGEICHKLGMKKNDESLISIAKKMRSWQRNILDHKNDPIISLFSQDRAYSFSTLQEANRSFFAQDSQENYESSKSKFFDDEFGLAIERRPGFTLLSVGSGCKSGMGAILLNDAGIVNYGFQSLPVGDCEGFGLAGRAQEVDYSDLDDGFSLSYTCRLAAYHPRQTGISSLRDSGYSRSWLSVNQVLDRNKIKLTCRIQGFQKLKDHIFTLFGCGQSCVVAQTHKLSPRSLDRYQGPAQSFALHGPQGGKIKIELKEGIDRMEIIPLAGDDSFWGAEFLVAFTLLAPSIQINFVTEKISI